MNSQIEMSNHLFTFCSILAIADCSTASKKMNTQSYV